MIIPAALRAHVSHIALASERAWELADLSSSQPASFRRFRSSEHRERLRARPTIATRQWRLREPIVYCAGTRHLGARCLGQVGASRVRPWFGDIGSGTPHPFLPTGRAADDEFRRAMRACGTSAWLVWVGQASVRAEGWRYVVIP